MKQFINAIRFGCWTYGHTWALHFERDRISLRCLACDYQTPGWELNLPAPRPVGARRFKKRLSAA